MQPIIDQLASGATPGKRVQGTMHVLYKVRAPNSDSSRGKRGGYRIIYHLCTPGEVLLVAIYSKADQADIGQDEVLAIVRGMDPDTDVP